jgi:hypothetical protein
MRGIDDSRFNSLWPVKTINDVRYSLLWYFFILVAAAELLTNQHAIFGRVS